LLPRTVIPRLLKQRLIWLVFATFAVTATIARLGHGGDAEEAAVYLEGGDKFVAFMIIFFVGYCYTRYNSQFDDIQHVMHHIVNACLLARATFSDPAETHRLWRYLNLMHASAYCGLTDYLNEANFFLPLCEKHGLLGTIPDIREEELDALHRVGLDNNGARACNMYEVWALELVREEVYRKGARVSPPIHARLQSEVTDIGDHVKKLFAYRYQVLPFIYTHLVSALSTFYVLSDAVVKGLQFAPDEYVVFSLLVPFIGLLIVTLATFGLLEVGNTILDPFGGDAEDFALLHFVEYALCMSYEAIQIQPCGSRVADRDKFYSAEEIACAKLVVMKMVKRHRWLKIIEHARLQKSLKQADNPQQNQPRSSWLDRSFQNSHSTQCARSSADADCLKTAGRERGANVAAASSAELKVVTASPSEVKFVDLPIDASPAEAEAISRAASRLHGGSTKSGSKEHPGRDSRAVRLGWRAYSDHEESSLTPSVQQAPAQQAPARVDVQSGGLQC